MAFDPDIAVEGLNKEIQKQNKSLAQKEKLIDNLVQLDAKKKSNMLVGQLRLSGQADNLQPSVPGTEEAIGPGGVPITGQTTPEGPEAIDVFDVSANEFDFSIGPTGKLITRKKGAKEQVFENIQNLKKQGIPLSEKEEKFANDFLGIADDGLRKDLRDVEAGKKTFEDVRKKRPDQAAAIRKAQRGALNPKSRNIINQVDLALKASTSAFAEGLSSKDPSDVQKELLKDLLNREQEARDKGIMIDEIFDILGFTREEIEAFEPEGE